MISRFAILFGVLLSMNALAQTNLLVNGDFEGPRTADGAPEGFELGWDGYVAGEAALDVEHAHGGVSLRCRVNGKEEFLAWNQGGIVIPPGVRFLKLSTWCRAADLDNTFATIGVAFESADGVWLSDRLWMIVAASETDWVQYEGYAEVPSDAQQLCVHGWINPQTRGTGTFWFDDLVLTPADAAPKPSSVYRDDQPPPTPTDNEQKLGYIAFTRDYTRILFSQSMPRTDERVDVLRVFAAPGEFEPVVLAIHALRDLEHVAVEVGALNGDAGGLKAETAVQSVRFHPRGGESRWEPFSELIIDDAPLFLERRESLRVSAGATQPFWLTVHVPGNAAPGEYRGEATISTGEGTAQAIPIVVVVYPIALDEAQGASFGMYTRIPTDAVEAGEQFADMRAHGLTTVAFMGKSGLEIEWEDTRPRILWSGSSPLELCMNTYSTARFPSAALWLQGEDLSAFCQQRHSMDTEEFASAYRDLIAQIVRHGREEGWREIVFQPVDEPFEHPASLDKALRLLEITQTVPGARTESNGMNSAWHRFDERAYALVDVLTLHDGPVLERGTLDMPRWWKFQQKTAADGKELWYYNVDLPAWRPEPLRFMTGFGLWKSKATGIVQWSYMPHLNPNNAGSVYGRPDNYFFRYPAATGESGGPTIGYEAIREGVDDYRYLLTLKNAVDEARFSGDGDMAALAEDLWTTISAKLEQATFGGSRGKAAQGTWTGPLGTAPDGTRIIGGDHKIDNNWVLGDYATLRRQIARAIVLLQRGQETAEMFFGASQ